MLPPPQDDWQAGNDHEKVKKAFLESFPAAASAEISHPPPLFSPAVPGTVVSILSSSATKITKNENSSVFTRNYMDILRPMKDGYRGEIRTIEFKKPQKSLCSASDLTDLIITTSIEKSPQI